MDATVILAGVGALTGLGALGNSIANTIANRSNGRSVAALEEGKLDLSAAELGSEIFRGIIAELRAEIKECDEDRIAQREVLVRYGLIPRPGDGKGDKHA